MTTGEYASRSWRAAPEDSVDSMRLEALRDGTTVLLRTPTAEDLGRSLRFFRGLPKRDRRYLRFDVTQSRVVERLIREAVEGRAYRILALIEDDVVGHGALEVSSGSWQSHIGEIRAIVTPRYRKRGLGGLLISELFQSAQRQDVQKAIVRLAGPQFVVRKVCERLGFRVDAVLRDHVRDGQGKVQDLIVMSYDLDDVSESLREFYSEENWPDG